MEQNAPERAPRLPSLTGLRIVAALGVVLFHYFVSWRGGALAWLPGWGRRLIDGVIANGWQGVNLFFLLSGFILAYTYGYSGRMRGEVRAFYIARLARVYPVYLVGWCAVFALSLVGAIDYGFPVPPLAVMGLSLVLLQAWLPATAFYWNPPGWTLADEAFFYAVFPLLLRWLQAYSVRALIVLLLALYAVLVGIGLVDRGTAHPADPTRLGLWVLVSTSNPLCRLPEFALGVGLGLLHMRGGSPLRPGAMVALGAATWLTICIGGGRGLGDYLVQHGLLDPLFAGIILGLAAGRGWTARLLGWGPIVLLGEASYSVYILHEPVYLALNHLGAIPEATDPRCVPFALVYVAVVLLAALTAYRLVEVPARRAIRARYRRPQSARRALHHALPALDARVVPE